MTTQKLTVGSGYEYLTRQVAAQDRAERGHITLTSYYTERGELPGYWLGSGLVGIDGIEPGDCVTTEQMRALFGAGVHPLAELPAARFEGERPNADAVDAAHRLGTPYQLPTPSPFQREVTARYEAAAKEDEQSPTQASRLRANVRDQVATEWFTEQYGRPPASEVELSAYLAKVDRSAGGSISGFDLTFSPVKSVSALWALADPQVAATIERCHQAAIKDTIDMIEKHALFTRLGKGGAYQVETRGLIAAAFAHRDSRAGDPDLHTHVVIANKVQAGNGRWLAINARVLYKAKVAASETYNTALEAHLRADLGVQFTPRPAPGGKRPIRELVGIDIALTRAWSQRRAAIDLRTERLAQQFQADHHRPATSVERLALAQQANLETRNAKHAPRTLAEQRIQWRQQADALLGSEAVEDMIGRILNPQSPRAPRLDDMWLDQTAARIVQTMEGQQATWQPWHVRAEAQRQARNADLPLPILQDTVEQLIDHTLDAHCIRLTTPEPGLGARYTSARIWNAEDHILELADRTDGRVLPKQAIADAMTRAENAGLRLNDGQRSLVWELAASGKRVQVALAPAGTGKTTAVSVLADAWTNSGGPVIGLAPSAAAARLLAEDLPGPCDTLAKYAWTIEHPEQPAPDWLHQIGPRSLLIIDEAGMADTPSLDLVIADAVARGATVRLLGDDQQLAAIGAGGVLRDIAMRHGAIRLDNPVRFTNPDEAAATLQVRAGNPQALQFYARERRVLVADTLTNIDRIHNAWRADRDAGLDSLMLAPTRELAAQLNQIAQKGLRDVRQEGRSVELADGTTASIGDRIITRHNDRGLRLSPTEHVTNGQRLTVTTVHADGSLTAQQPGTRTRVRLPADYVREHVTLGYATTIHTAQGTTVDTSHTLLAGQESRQLLYTALSRGRHSNKIYLASDTGEHHPFQHCTDDPIQTLLSIFGRDESPRSAHATWAYEAARAATGTGATGATTRPADQDRANARAAARGIGSPRR